MSPVQKSLKAITSLVIEFSAVRMKRWERNTLLLLLFKFTNDINSLVTETEVPVTFWVDKLHLLKLKVLREKSYYCIIENCNNIES